MTSITEVLQTLNGSPVAIDEVPVVGLQVVADLLVAHLGRPTVELSALFGIPHGHHGLRLYAVLSDSANSCLSLLSCDVAETYPCLTRQVPQAHWFEREIAEQWGVVPAGHPWLKPIRFHAAYRDGHDAWQRSAGDTILPCVQPAGTEYFQVDGSEVHEVAVGPVHAGVIEPGHFRFQCHGESVFALEIELGYQHRGIERRLVGGPDKRSVHYMETLAGDTSVGHATAYCQLLEGLAGQEPSTRAQAIRAMGLELERLANHTGDLGALAGDVGFLTTLSFCGRIRGDFLNASGQICGSRFGRGLLRPGGVAFDIDSRMADDLQHRISAAHRDVSGAAELLWRSASAMARFENTGTISYETVRALGVLGVAGRASGNDRDVRRDFPSGYYRYAQVPVSTWYTGDAFARGYLRHLEIQRSCRFLLEHLPQLPEGETSQPLGRLAPNSMVVSLVEGWRGEICHVAMTGSEGYFSHYKVIDPSFHNWIGLAMALRNQQISDFPLCNKSFNLSYCGHDL